MESLDPVVCQSCGARFPVEHLSVDDYLLLQNQHSYYSFTEELRMLKKVKTFYKRYPEVKGRIKPHFVRVQESDDPFVLQQLRMLTPYDEILLPTEQLPLSAEVIAAEVEVIDYLQTNEFSLPHRLAFVSEQTARCKVSVGRVVCPTCKTGHLSLDANRWVSPDVIG